MPTFETLELAMQLIRLVRPLIEKIQRRDRNLAAQLRSATTSVPSCLSEGAQRWGQDRLHLYRVAAGSAAEAKVQLGIAVAWGYVTATEAAEALATADRIVAMIWGLLRRGVEQRDPSRQS